MNENKTNTAEIIAEEELEGVAGGADDRPGYTDCNPIRSLDCWKTLNGGSEHRDGRWRKKCRTVNACRIQIVSAWYCCKCWETNACIGTWHVDSGCN